MDQEITTLEDHLAIMRRRWRIPVTCALIGVLLGLGVSLLQDPVYSASTSVLLEPQRVSTSAIVMDDGEVATQAQVIASAPVAERVIEEFGLEEEPDVLLDDVTVEVLDDTRAVAVTVRRPSAREAADISNAFATQYIRYRAEEVDQAAAALRDEMATQLGRIDAELEDLRSQLRDPLLSERRRIALEERERTLLTAEAELRVDLAMSNADKTVLTQAGQVLRRANPAASATQPRPIRAAGFGGLVGLVVGVLLAYVRDRVDDRLRDERRLRSAVGGLPVLGRLRTQPRTDSRLVTVTAPHSPASEGYRALTTSLRFLLSERDGAQGGQMLVVCSADAGEMKTTTAANVAVTAARVGLRVILVDADLRNPGVAACFGLETPIGLSHVITDQAELEKVVVDGAEHDLPGLSIVGAGAVPPNPAELLAGPKAAATWHELRGMADLVVVDTPPLLSVADALEIVGSGDVTALVARHGTSRARHVGTALERIRQVGGTVDGVVWCDVPERDASSGYGPEA